MDYTDIMTLLGFNPKKHLRDQYIANRAEQERAAGQ